MATSNPTKYTTAFNMVFGEQRESATRVIDTRRPNKGRVPSLVAWGWVIFVGAVSWMVMGYAAVPSFGQDEGPFWVLRIPGVGQLLILFAARTLVVRVVTQLNEPLAKGVVKKRFRIEFDRHKTLFVGTLMIRASIALHIVLFLVLLVDAPGQPQGAMPAPTPLFILGAGGIVVVQIVAAVGGVVMIFGVIRLALRIAAQSRYTLEQENWVTAKGGLLSAVLGISVATDDDLAAVTITDREIRIFPVPVAGMARFDDIEQNLVKNQLLDYMLKPGSTPNDITLTMADEATIERRKNMRDTDGVIAEFDSETGLGVLGDKVGRNDLASVQEHLSQLNFTLVDHNLRIRPKVFRATRVTPAEAAIYESFGRVLGVNVWDFSLEVEWVPNEEADQGEYPMRFERIVVRGNPAKGMRAEDRVRKWEAIVTALPKGNDGCPIEDDQVTGITVLRYGQPRRLPDRFATIETLPAALSPELWATIPLGADETNRPVLLNLPAVPHVLVAGKPGSGKSTLLRQDMISRLARGHAVCVFDPAKHALSLRPLKPYTVMWGTEIEEVANCLAYLAEETIRRGALIEEYDHENWYDFTLAERELHRIMPITVYFDEYESAVEVMTVHKTLGDDHPSVIAAKTNNTAVALMQDYMARIGKQARYAGIYLVVATQFPYKEKLGDVRNVLGNAIQLHAQGSAIQLSEIGLAMGSSAGDTADLFERFGTPKPGEKAKPGLGVLRNEEGVLTAMRVGFAEPTDAAAIIASTGVSLVQPWIIEDVLNLDTPRPIDKKDTRVPIAAPVTLMTHLKARAHDDFDASLEAERPSELAAESESEVDPEDADAALLKRIQDRNRTRRD